MTDKEQQESAIRRAAREITKPLERKLMRYERTIDALRQKLESSERELIEARKKNLKLQNELMRS